MENLKEFLVEAYDAFSQIERHIRPLEYLLVTDTLKQNFEDKSCPLFTSCDT